MQLLVNPSDITEAPVEAKQWISKSLGLAITPPPADPKPKAGAKAKKQKDETPVEEVTRELVIEAATELMKSKGTEVLKSVLKKLKVDRVGDCPDDKLADLLAEIATHA